VIALEGAPPAITAAGAGHVALGAAYTALRRDRRIGTLAPGCELAGLGARWARLRAPLRGAVGFTRSAPRRVRSITILGGASARGVGVGATTAQARRAFPHATLDRSSERVFGIALLTVPKRDGGRFQLAVDASTGKVTEIGIPAVAFCE
jgi:hypothetical protein